MIRSLLLKAVATGITVLTAATSAGYVSGHVKHGSAPLHPAVTGGSAFSSGQTGGRLSLSVSVHSANVETVTSTYAS